MSSKFSKEYFPYPLFVQPPGYTRRKADDQAAERYFLRRE
jgi:hypothetical protein